MARTDLMLSMRLITINARGFLLLRETGARFSICGIRGRAIATRAPLGAGRGADFAGGIGPPFECTFYSHEKFGAPVVHLDRFERVPPRHLRVPPGGHTSTM